MSESKEPFFRTKELELPETRFVRDIENRVLQGIVLQCLAEVEGITPIEGSFIQSLLSRATPSESIAGILAEQDSKTHAVRVKVEVNVCYGYSIPEIAEKIQVTVSEAITRFTGLHVGTVHVIFKELVPPSGPKRQQEGSASSSKMS